MGSGGIVHDLRGSSGRSKPFTSVIPFAGFSSVPQLGKEYIEGKEEEPKATHLRYLLQKTGKNTNDGQKNFLTDLKSFIVCFHFWSVFSWNIVSEKQH